LRLATKWRTGWLPRPRLTLCCVRSMAALRSSCKAEAFYCGVLFGGAPDLGTPESRVLVAELFGLGAGGRSPFE